jgi:Flp pilus assembly pilin Flp
MQNIFGEFGVLMGVLWREDEGQDLIEYTVLLAFVAMASATMFIGAGGKIKSIWTVTNNTLSNAASYATT